MYARVTIASVKPDKVDEINKIMKDSILPAAKKQKGFKGFYSLTDKKSSKGMVIVLWNTEADMMAGESSTYYKDQVAKAAPLLSAAPVLEHYEVTVKG